MSKKTRSTRPSRKISSVARKLKARGYVVRSSSGFYVSPKPIRGIVPDIVARKGNQMIVVEVKRANEVARMSRRLRALAMYAEKNRNVRFDIITVPENSGKKWNAFEVKRLRALARQNTPTRVIGLRLGRTSDSVYKRAAIQNISLAPIESIGLVQRKRRLAKKNK